MNLHLLTKNREAIEMGEIQMTSTDLKRVIDDLARDFPGTSYHITTRSREIDYLYDPYL